MPSFMVKSWWSDQTQQGGGGGSGADMVTTKAMMEGTPMGGDGAGLSVDQATLDTYTKGTSLEGRATIDQTLAGTEKLGVTDMYGRVKISPDAFQGDALLNVVVEHEGVHVGQVMSANFANPSSQNYKYARALNELEGYRRGLDVTNQYSFAGNPGLESEWGVEVDKIAELTDVLRNSPYSSRVANWPYNYQLGNGDQCPATSCYIK
jgi:hypothetical protein